MTKVRHSYQLIPSTDTDDPKLLESDWTRRTIDHIQP